MLKIISNGSGSVLPLAALYERLEGWALDPDFEGYGNFIGDTMACRHAGYGADGKAIYEPTGPIYPESPDAVRFFGNFAEYSHVFTIDTDEPAVIEQLTAAIRANQATEAYARLRVVRKAA